MIDAVLIALLAYLFPAVCVALYGCWLVVFLGLIEEEKDSLVEGVHILKASIVWPVLVKARYNSVMKGTDS